MNPDNCTMRSCWSHPDPPERGALGTVLPKFQQPSAAVKARRRQQLREQCRK